MDIRNKRTLSKSEVCNFNSARALEREDRMSEMKQYMNPHSGQMEWRYQPHPDSDEALKVAYSKIPEVQRAHFRKETEMWTEEGAPKQQPGEGKSTFILRCQQEDYNREKVLKQRTISAYEESNKPTKEEKFIGMMEEEAKISRTEREAKQQAAAEVEEAKEKARKKIEASEKMRSGGGGHGVVWRDSQDVK